MYTNFLGGGNTFSRFRRWTNPLVNGGLLGSSNYFAFRWGAPGGSLLTKLSRRNLAALTDQSDRHKQEVGGTAQAPRNIISRRGSSQARRWGAHKLLAKILAA